MVKMVDSLDLYVYQPLFTASGTRQMGLGTGRNSPITDEEIHPNGIPFDSNAHNHLICHSFILLEIVRLPTFNNKKGECAQKDKLVSFSPKQANKDGTALRELFAESHVQPKE
jgi:hypothetical protein